MCGPTVGSAEGRVARRDACVGRGEGGRARGGRGDGVRLPQPVAPRAPQVAGDAEQLRRRRAHRRDRARDHRARERRRPATRSRTRAAGPPACWSASRRGARVQPHRLGRAQAGAVGRGQREQQVRRVLVIGRDEVPGAAPAKSSIACVWQTPASAASNGAGSATSAAPTPAARARAGARGAGEADRVADRPRHRRRGARSRPSAAADRDRREVGACSPPGSLTRRPHGHHARRGVRERRRRGRRVVIGAVAVEVPGVGQRVRRGRSSPCR